jgi:N-acetylneuraminic acid mutarotase
VALVLLCACTSNDEADVSPGSEVGAVGWRRLSPAPSKRTEVTATALDARIFVIGGFSEAGDTVSDVEVYDTKTDSWDPGLDLPIAVNHAMAATLDQTVYLIGGYLGPGLENATDRAFAFRDGRWDEIPRMPEARAAGGAAALDGAIYVAGGVGPDDLADEMFVFDPSANEWTTARGAPTVREHLGVAAHRGLLYVVGGRTGGIGSNLAAAEVFEPATEAWTQLRDMPTARGGIGAAATSNGYVLAAGGEADSVFDDAEAFDVEGRRWIVLPPMPTARHGLGVVAVGTVVYAIAGGPEPGFAFSDVTESINLSSLRDR